MKVIQTAGCERSLYLSIVLLYEERENLFQGSDRRLLSSGIDSSSECDVGIICLHQGCEQPS